VPVSTDVTINPQNCLRITCHIDHDYNVDKVLCAVM